MSTDLDTRLHAARPDLADLGLKGVFDAARYVESTRAGVRVPLADVYRRPEADGPVDTQVLYGETVKVFEEKDGWCWVQAEADGYVGYLRADALDDPVAATHAVTARTTFVYPVADLKSVPIHTLSMGSRLKLGDETVTRGLPYAALEGGGFVVSGHTAPLGHVLADFVTVAERFLAVPYRWAGRSGFGIDCSGLVQLAMAMAGLDAPRDSDMQEAGVGAPLADDAPLQRGDLIFWSGHVGIMTDAEMMLHANGKTMDVSQERLADAIQRIEPLYGRPTSRRRPERLSAQ